MVRRYGLQVQVENAGRIILNRLIAPPHLLAVAQNLGVMRAQTDADAPAQGQLGAGGAACSSGLGLGRTPSPPPAAPAAAAAARAAGAPAQAPSPSPSLQQQGTDEANDDELLLRAQVLARRAAGPVAMDVDAAGAGGGAGTAAARAGGPGQEHAGTPWPAGSAGDVDAAAGAGGRGEAGEAGQVAEWRAPNQQNRYQPQQSMRAAVLMARSAMPAKRPETGPWANFSNLPAYLPEEAAVGAAL